jgi:DNA-directed RNA polymerase specialized sigma24 family protein
MLDPLLRGFVEAPEEAEAEQRLATLLEEEAAPLIGKIAARKLRAYGVGSAGFSQEDLEDVAADALLALVSRLQALRSDPHSGPIESFADYTATVTYNTFAHYLRRRHPARSRLKNRLRYALTSDRRFGLWPTSEGLVCGLAVWRGRPASAPAAESLSRMAVEPDRWLPSMRRRPGAWADPTVSLGPLLLALGGPVEFDRMVGTMAALSSAEGEQTSVDAAVLESLPDESAPPADVALDRRRETQRLWQEISSLPLRQRIALLLSLRDTQGAALLWVFPLTGVASIRHIARTLEIPDLELAELWSRLPLDDLSIGGRLGCTRQQAINLRSAARKRLAHRLAEPRVTSLAMRGRGNIKPVPASLRDEA